MLLFEVEGEAINVQEEKQGRNWNKADMGGLKASLKATDWDLHLNNMNTEEAWLFF